MAEQYELHGLHLHPEATPTEIQKGTDGKLTLIAESKRDGKVVLEGLDHVLLATGRKPNTKNLGCEEVPALLLCTSCQKNSGGKCKVVRFQLAAWFSYL